MESFRFWQVGTDRRPRPRRAADRRCPFLLVGAVLALAGARLLNTLALGDDLARGLGRRTDPRPDRDRRSPSSCSPARPPRWPARSPSSASSCPHVVRSPRRPRPPRVLPVLDARRRGPGRGRRHRRPGRPAAVGGAGRHHGRRRRRARLPRADPPHREGACEPDPRPLAPRRRPLRTPSTSYAVRAARRGVHHRRLLAGLVVAAGRRLRRARPARRLHRHGPRLRPDPRRRADPRRHLHRDGVQAPAGGAGGARRRRLRRGRRHLPDHAAQPAGQPRHRRREPRAPAPPPSSRSRWPAGSGWPVSAAARRRRARASRSRSAPSPATTAASGSSWPASASPPRCSR